jgi:membrane-associated phospholipid phosphatase
MRALTDFGDAAVVLPLSAVMLLWLLRFHARRAAVSWVVAVGLCIVGTALLKIVLYVCPPVPDLVNPSGHTGLSMLVYGGIVLAIAAEERGWRRAAVLAAGAALIVGIAGSRLLLKMHSALEVGVGILIGTLTLTVFARGYLRSRSEERPLLPLVLPVIGVITLLHGHELRAEGYLHAISRYFHLDGNACGG